MLDQIKELINSLPYIAIDGEKAIRFQEPVIVTPPVSNRAYYVWGVSITDQGENVQWMDSLGCWQFLLEEIHPDEVIGEGIIKRLKALQVSVTPIENNPDYHQFL